MLSPRLFLPVLLATAAMLAAPAAAQSIPPNVAAQSIPPNVAAAVSNAARPEGDTKRDADRKPAESVAFAGIKPGDSVLELLAFGGYYTRILSKTVGPTGHVYATVSEAFLATHANFADGLKAIAADPAYANVTVLVQANGAPAAPVPVDVVWTSDNYHDLHNPGPFGADDIAGFNKAVFAALKPGGSFIVIDHASAAGTGVTQTGTLHRIDSEAVKREVTAAGFTFDGASDALHRANEDYTAKASDKDEQFILRFRKP